LMKTRTKLAGRVTSHFFTDDGLGQFLAVIFKIFKMLYKKL